MVIFSYFIKKYFDSLHVIKIKFSKILPEYYTLRSKLLVGDTHLQLTIFKVFAMSNCKSGKYKEGTRGRLILTVTLLHRFNSATF